jgi:kynurenine 3-monooxygenase
MNYQQEYISDEYVETRIPAGMDVKNQPTYLLDPNHLHIWPRHSFMLIALPNKVWSMLHRKYLSSATGSQAERYLRINLLPAPYLHHVLNYRR